MWRGKPKSKRQPKRCEWLMKKKIEAELPDEPAGFRAGRSAVDMLCVL